MTVSTSPTPPPGLAPGGRFEGWSPTGFDYLVLDVDGTLVGEHDQVREDARAAIRRAISGGMQVGYATGRMHSALTEIDGAIALPGPHVVHNGAQVRGGGRTLELWPLTDEDVRALVDVARGLDAYAELYLPDGYVVTKDEPRARVHWDLLGQPPLGGAGMVDGQPVLKATFIGFDDAETERIVAGVGAVGLESGPAHSLLTPGLTYVNATRRGVDKGSALGAAATHAGGALHTTVAIGDGHNDLPMLAVAGTAIAMGQGDPLVHASAHLVTGHVDDGGLATAINAVLDLRATLG